jgi:hypothetical protein
MMSRIFVAVVTTCLLVISSSSGAQTSSADVTFRLPLNLTQLSSDIAKIAVFCRITSDAIPPSGATGKAGGKLSKQEEFPVSGGQLVTTAVVIVPVSGLDNPIGKTANYECLISGFSTSLQQWSRFEEASTTPAFKLSPTPPQMTGSFIW